MDINGVKYTLQRLTAGTYSHHPFFSRKNDLNQTSMIMMFQPLIFRGVTVTPPINGSKKSTDLNESHPGQWGTLLRVAAIRPRRILYRTSGDGVLREINKHNIPNNVNLGRHWGCPLGFSRFKMGTYKGPKTPHISEEISNGRTHALKKPESLIARSQLTKRGPLVRSHSIFDGIFQIHSLKLTFSHLKIGRAPKGNDRIPTIHFQVRAVSFREGKQCYSLRVKFMIGYDDY